MELSPLFENDDFLIINKPAGIVVQKAKDRPYSLSQFISDKYTAVHRLDKDTSGCLLIAKHKTALRELNKLFEEKQVSKVYWCLSLGIFGKEKGTIEYNLARTQHSQPFKVEVNPKGKRTQTQYTILKTFSYKKYAFSLIELELITGFMHQIRVHMKHEEHPLVGDCMYGNREVNNLNLISRQFLHAKRLSFSYKGTHFDVEAPLFDDLKQVLHVLEDR